MFVGRQAELKTLEKLYLSDDFEFAVVYGRRRVGKSTLLQRFVEGKKAIYYTAIRSSSQRNLELVGNRVIEALAPEMKGLSFQSYEQLFSFVGQRCCDERIIFIIDEFPYMAEADKYRMAAGEYVPFLMWFICKFHGR